MPVLRSEPELPALQVWQQAQWPVLLQLVLLLAWRQPAWQRQVFALLVLQQVSLLAWRPVWQRPLAWRRSLQASRRRPVWPLVLQQAWPQLLPQAWPLVSPPLWLQVWQQPVWQRLSPQAWQQQFWRPV